MPPIRLDVPPYGVPDPTPSPLVVWARRFPPTSWGVRSARSFAAGTVESALRGSPALGSPAQVEDLAADVGLVASELASNAVRHAATSFEVVLDFGGGRVRVEVRDGSTATPRRDEAAGRGTTGRGLVVVDRLTVAWGVEPTARGKVVWAELPLAVLSREARG